MESHVTVPVGLPSRAWRFASYFRVVLFAFDLVTLRRVEKGEFGRTLEALIFELERVGATKTAMKSGTLDADEICQY